MRPDFHNPATRATQELPALIRADSLRSWSGAPTEYPRNHTVAALFEQVASERPQASALVAPAGTLTYAELNRRANRLAHQLRRMGVGPEALVGCCVERSADLIIALLAILKAGGAYVPLDPGYPKERFDLLLEDAGAPLVITQKPLASGVLEGRGLQLLCLDDLGDAATNHFISDDQNPQILGGPTDLAYVMFTSGSTGRPKGVMVQNRSIVRLVRNTNYCHFGPEQVFLQFAPVSFDASTFEIWGPLLNGGTLVLMPPRTASLEDLGRTIREQRVTTLWLTSGLFNLMVEQRLDDLRHVRQLLTGGDVLSPRHVQRALDHLPNCTVINGYGPTENTTFTCCHAMHSGETVPDSVPIGRPIANTQIHILDERMRPVSPGNVGELYAAGDGVARGYLNDSQSTADKFLLNPFTEDSSERMYRTGDLARWRNDGVIEFVGRIDNQVKILGHRVEPGEVESALRTHALVRQVCVVPHPGEHGSKRLVAYYVPSGHSGPSPRHLREFLAETLPQYMIPALFVPLPELPLSPNGKLDRSALPNPALARDLVQAPATKPSEVEGALLNIWRQVLATDNVGLEDNFFDLGGDSLLLVSVHASLQKLLQTQIPVTALFEFPTVRTLARHLAEQHPADASLLAAQQRAQKQRQAFARHREHRPGGAS